MTRKMKENRELKKQKDEKLRVLLMTITAYFVFFIIKKMDIITQYLGIVMLILLYMYANYNLINMFFNSKRTTFKIYAFLLLEVIYLFTGNISMAGSIIYAILFSLLIFSIISLTLIFKKFLSVYYCYYIKIKTQCPSFGCIRFQLFPSSILILILSNNLPKSINEDLKRQQ